MACTAEDLAPATFFSPMRLATVAVVAMHSPITTVNRILRIDSVIPTAETASDPSPATK